MEFQIFIDDSGRGQEHQSAFVLAGLIFSASDSANFATEWISTLHAPPHVEHFKSYEAYGYRGEFKGWSEDARDRKLLELIGVVRKYYASGVKLVVSGHGFDRILLNKKDPALKNLYVLAVAAITTKILSIAFDVRIPPTLDFIFDTGMLHDKVFKQAFEEMMRANVPKEALQLFACNPHMEDDKKFPPLQAADLIARHIREEYEIAAGGIERAWVVSEALRGLRMIDAPLDRRALEYLKQALAPSK